MADRVVIRAGDSRLDELLIKEQLPSGLDEALAGGDQTAIPRVAKEEHSVTQIENIVCRLPTTHELVHGDARELASIADDSVHLVLTSPPYWTLKSYPERDGQLGLVEEYDSFLDELDRVWAHARRVLVPGGRLIVVVGDVCLSRRRNGRHVVLPLHAAIQERCRRLGLDNLAPIIWYKISNARYEVENGNAGFLGKPYEPNGVVKNDIEYILFQRKAGSYRSPPATMRALSVIPEMLHRTWFQQVWTLPGASTRHHPAPFPLELAERLIRMFSFAGDTVLDPFTGTGTTNVAAALWGRNSIGYEVEESYFRMSEERLRNEAGVARLALTVRERGPEPARIH